jgi:hypothetical protein
MPIGLGSRLRNTRDLVGRLLERLGGIDADDSAVSPPLKRGAGDHPRVRGAGDGDIVNFPPK